MFTCVAGGTSRARLKAERARGVAIRDSATVLAILQLSRCVFSAECNRIRGNELRCSRSWTPESLPLKPSSTLPITTLISAGTSFGIWNRLCRHFSLLSRMPEVALASQFWRNVIDCERRRLREQLAIWSLPVGHKILLTFRAANVVGVECIRSAGVIE